MDTQKIQLSISVGIVLVVLAIGGWWFLQEKTTQTETVNIGGVNVDLPKGATIEIVEDEQPPLEHKVAFEEGVPEDVRKALQKHRYPH